MKRFFDRLTGSCQTTGGLLKTISLWDRFHLYLSREIELPGDSCRGNSRPFTLNKPPFVARRSGSALAGGQISAEADWERISRSFLRSIVLETVLQLQGIRFDCVRGYDFRAIFLSPTDRPALFHRIDACRTTSARDGCRKVVRGVWGSS